MLNFYRINSVNDSLFQPFFELYNEAFPAVERRSWAGLEHELKFEKRFCAHALMQDCKFAGLFNYWTFDTFYYIEHLAILPDFQGHKIGTEAIKIYKTQTKLPIIFEVEMPTTPDSIRRINFYEKQGFHVVSHKYAQPPYHSDGFLIPMELMTNQLHFADTHFNIIKDTLYNQVYHYEVEKEVENK